MFRRIISNIVTPPGGIVGTIHSPVSLRAALRVAESSKLDLFEVRADAFLGDLPLLERGISKLKLPIILTVRDSREGGAARLSVTERRALFERFLPFASLVDIELRNAANFSELIATAQAANVKVIASFHDFQRTPSRGRLDSLASRARICKAGVLKIAARVSTAADLAALLSFLHRETRMPLSVMGMGPLGKISRLLFAMSGSVLTYGYLGEPQVSGQWPALRLKQRLAELTTGPGSGDA